MRNTFFVIPALALVVFGTLLALDIINFEEGLAGETSPTDRWVMIFSFAGAAAFIGLTIADSGHDDDAAVTGRAAAAQKLGAGRPDPSELPAKPGSLLKKTVEPQPADDDEPAAPLVPSLNEAIDAAVPDTAEPFADEPFADEPEPVAVEPVPTKPVEPIDPVDAELQSLIDDDQMEEINELVAAAEADAASNTTVPDADEASEIVPASESVEPLARLELRLADYDDDDLKRVVKESESVVISEMVRSGQLTSEGELTQQDIASMVFLAYTSDEMLTELRLRKSMDAETTGHPGLEASTGSDLAPLKNIE